MSKHKNNRKNRDKKSLRDNAHRRKDEIKQPWHTDLHPETKNSILAVVCFAFSAVTLLSYWHKAGFLGEYMFGLINWLFGNGYFLAPLTSLLIGFSFLYSLRRKLIAATMIGAFFFFSSALGILDLLFKDFSGGHIGFYFTYPIFSFFDFWAALVIEIAIFAASIMVMLNVPIMRFKEEMDEEGDKKDSGIKEAVSDAVKA